MKKFLLAVILVSSLFSLNEVIQAQDFTFTRIGPNISIPYNPNDTPVVQIKGRVQNLTIDSIDFKITRLIVNTPLDWETQMCYELCYAGFIDSIPYGDTSYYTLLPSQQADSFYIDFYCRSQGIGSAIVQMFEYGNPLVSSQDTFIVDHGSTSIHQTSSNVEDFRLEQNYPNPFNPSTKIKFAIPKTDFVNLKVYDILGNEVSDLINNRQLNVGTYEYEFSTSGLNLSSGVYYYKLTSSEFTQVRKMMLIK